MLKSQLVTLHNTGQELLGKANLATSVRDVKAFTELGLQLLREAREIALHLETNSALLFFEVSAHLSLKGDKYSAYLEFCARNGLDILAEQDFNALAKSVFDVRAAGVSKTPLEG